MTDGMCRGSSEGSDSTQNGSDGELEDDFRSPPSARSKKRVQFHSDENLVRIREIPSRGEQQAGDEDDSSDYDDDEDDNWRSGDRGGAIPVIVGNAVKLDSMPRGSYSVSKTKGRGSNLVAQITGVTISNLNKQKQKRSSSKERKVKKAAKPTADKGDTSKTKHKPGRRKAAKKESEGNGSPRKSKDAKSVKTSIQNTSKPSPRALSPVKKTPAKQDVQSDDSTSTSRSNDGLALSTTQPLSVGNVYTMDGFIFPSDPSDHIKARTSDVSSEISKSELSKSVLQRKKCFAWHMANGDQHDVLFGTPCILPLWESVQSFTPTAKNGYKTKV